MVSRLNISQHCALLAKVASNVLGCLRKEECCRKSRELILPLSTGEATAGVPCLLLGSLLQQRHGSTGDCLAKGWTKMMKGPEHLP